MNNKKLLAMALMIMGASNAMDSVRTQYQAQNNIHANKGAMSQGSVQEVEERKRASVSQERSVSHSGDPKTNAHVVKKSAEEEQQRLAEEEKQKKIKKEYTRRGYRVEHLPDSGEGEPTTLYAWLDGISRHLNQYDYGEEEKFSKEKYEYIKEAIQCAQARVHYQQWPKNQLTRIDPNIQTIKDSLLRLKKKNMIEEDIVQGSDSKGEGNNPNIQEINANIQKIKELIARLRKVKKDKKIKQELRDEAVTRMKKIYSTYNDGCRKCTYNYPSSDNNSIVDRLSSGLEAIKKKIGPDQ